MYADYTVATPWIGLLIATGNRMPMNPALWFFTALFFVAIFFQLLLKIQNEKSRVAVAFLVSLAAIMASTLTRQSYFWNIDIALSCLFFYVLGAEARSATNRLDLLRPNAIYLGLMIIVTFASSVQFSSNNSGIDINNRIYGASEWVFLFNAILGSLAIFLLAKLIPKNFFLTFISKNSLPLFAVHMVAFRVLTAILIAGFGFARAEIEGIFFLISYFLWAFVFALPIIYLGRKYLPFALGVKTPAAHKSLYVEESRASIAKE
jgi:fucose 4-O-acetylase-like acetyltransferase